MQNNYVYRKLLNIDEIHSFLRFHGSFIQQDDLAKYANKRLEFFDDADLEAFTESFRVIVANDSNHMLAGCFIFEGGWLQDIFFDDKASFQQLLTGIQNENISNGVHLGPYRPSKREIMVEVFESLKYDKDVDYESTINLIDAAQIQSSFPAIHWKEDLDQRFFDLYNSLTSHPYPWDVMKYQAGGGEFCPNLWLIDDNDMALVGINQPVNTLTNESVFNIVFADGNKTVLQSLLQHALQEMSRVAPTGIVYAHANQSTIQIFRDRDFIVNTQTPVYTYTSIV